MTQIPDPTQVLPHEGDMIFIDRILSHEKLKTICEFTWKKNSVFSNEKGELPQGILIEVAAQAVGIHAGLRQEERKAKDLAFLVGANQVQLPKSPLPGGVLFTIEVSESWLDDVFGVFGVTITDLSGDSFFSGQLKLFKSSSADSQ